MRSDLSYRELHGDDVVAAKRGAEIEEGVEAFVAPVPSPDAGAPKLGAPIWSAVPNKKVKASTVSSIFNLTNTILGSGVIAMPFAVKKSGLVFFVGMLLTVALLSDYAVKLLFIAVDVMTSKRPNDIDPEHVSYSALGKVMGNRKLEMIGSWSVTLQQIGCCIAYVVVIGDILEPIAQHFIWDDAAIRSIMQIVTLVFVIFPLTLLRQFDSLKFTSFLAIAFIVSFVCVVLVYGAMAAAGYKGSEIRSGSLKIWPDGVNILSSIPIMTFAYLCHQNTFPIYREMDSPSPKNMGTVSHFSIGICTAVYLGSGIFGYVITKDDTESDLFKNFKFDGSTINYIMDIVSVGFGFAIVFSYPVVVWEARRNIQHLVFGKKHFSFGRYVALNAVIVTTTGIIGVLAHKVDTVLGIVGSTCSPMMIYVLPPLLFLEARKFMNPAELLESSADARGAYGLLILGIVLIPLCVTLWVLGLCGVL
eukprot:g5453.t1